MSTDPTLKRLAEDARSTGMPRSFTTMRTNIELNGKPLELWVVVALVVLAGVYLLQLSLRALPDSFRLFTIAFFPHSLAFVLLVLIVLIGALGIALLALARLLHKGDRVGRGLAYVAVASLTGMVLFSNGGATTGMVLSMLAGIAAAVVLAFAPAVEDVFTGGRAPQRDQPTSIVVARVALAVWLVLLGLAAVLNFCLTGINGKFAVIGVLLAALAAGGFLLFRGLQIADRRTRIIATVGAVVVLVLLMIGRHDAGFAVLFGLTISIPVALWLPPDARAFYGDRELIVARQR